MRILMLTPSFHPRAGGVEKHVLRVSRELAGRGHEVAILTPQWDPAWPLEETIEGLAVTRVPRRLSLASWRARSACFRWAEIIHSHDAYPVLRYYLPWRWMLPHRPLFITFHGYEGYPIPREAIRKRRWVARRVQGALCMGAFIEKWYGTPCSLVSYGGVDLPSAVTPSPATNNAVFIGRLEPDTGILSYLDALRLLRGRHGLQISLDICGDGSLRAEVERRIVDERLAAQVHGFVADTRPFLENARLALVSGYLAMQEAMAAGRLVCALYDNPVKRDYLEMFPPAESALLIGGGAEELAEGIARHLSDSTLMEAKIAAGREWVRDKTWAQVADAYERLWAGDASCRR
jgi:glycosyltransferase involved in cell wall biosynthesis